MHLQQSEQQHSQCTDHQQDQNAGQKEKDKGGAYHGQTVRDTDLDLFHLPVTLLFLLFRQIHTQLPGQNQLVLHGAVDGLGWRLAHQTEIDRGAEGIDIGPGSLAPVGILLDGRVKRRSRKPIFMYRIHRSNGVRERIVQMPRSKVLWSVVIQARPAQQHLSIPVTFMHL